MLTEDPFDNNIADLIFPLDYYFQPCPTCNGIDYIKSGWAPSKTGGTQRLRCRIDKTRYDDNPLPGMNKPSIIDSVLNQCVNCGGHYAPVARNMRSFSIVEKRVVYISKSTVHNIISDTYEQVKFIENKFFHTMYSSDWEIDDMFQRRVRYKSPEDKLVCNHYKVTNILSVKPRYWLVSRVTPRICLKQAKTAIAEAVLRAGYSPLVIRCDGSRTLRNACNMTLVDTELYTKTKDEEFEIVNYDEILHRIIRSMNIGKRRRFPSLFSLQRAVDLCRFQYNFLRPHKKLQNRTPAMEAGIKYPFRTWIDLLTFAYRIRFG